MASVHVATLNIRNLADRWDERLPLLLADMAALQPDVLGLQEVVYPLQQDRLIGAGGEGRYESTRGWAGRPEYGNALLVRGPLAATDPERLDLGLQRSAIRAAIGLHGGATLLVAVTHLHHVTEDEALRDEQARQLLDWLAVGPQGDGLIVDGRLQRRAGRADLRPDAGRRASAPRTSRRTAPSRPSRGRPASRRRQWTRTARPAVSTTSGSGAPIRVEACGLAFDRPAVGDPTLFPSDHLGLSARITVG